MRTTEQAFAYPALPAFRVTNLQDGLLDCIESVDHLQPDEPLLIRKGENGVGAMFRGPQTPPMQGMLAAAKVDRRSFA